MFKFKRITDKKKQKHIIKVKKVYTREQMGARAKGGMNNRLQLHKLAYI